MADGDRDVDQRENQGDQRFNFYGSAISEGSQEASEDQEAGEDRPEEPQVSCKCKSACKTKKRTPAGKGCPCKTVDRECTASCKCGSKCANKPTDGEANVEAEGRARLPTDAIERQTLERRQSEQRARAFVEELTPEQQQQLLVQLLTSGRGNIDFARNMLFAAENPPDPENNPPDIPRWCRCRKCEAMPTPDENKCCRQLPCITNYENFANYCLDRLGLELTIRGRAEIRVEHLDFSSESYRKAAYRTYILWKHGTLGRGNRRVIPSCVVWAIRRRYQSEDGQYMGFRNE